MDRKMLLCFIIINSSERPFKPKSFKCLLLEFFLFKCFLMEFFSVFLYGKLFGYPPIDQLIKLQLVKLRLLLVFFQNVQTHTLDSTIFSLIALAPTLFLIHSFLILYFLYHYSSSETFSSSQNFTFSFVDPFLSNIQYHKAYWSAVLYIFPFSLRVIILS